MNNQELTIGKVDPSSNTAYDPSNIQYILNWIGAGGDQTFSDYSGNTNVKSLIDGDNKTLQYNIPDNKIGFFFSDMCDNNINVRDAQYIMNNQTEPVDISYAYPASKEFICLVVLEEVTINYKLYYKNKLYLKRKNIEYSHTNLDTSFNPLILANCIPYLSLNDGSGNIVKRNDVVMDGSSSIQLYEFGFDINGDLSTNYIYSIPGADYITGDISRNVNNLFPPIKDFSDNYTWLGINDATLSNSNSDIKYTTKFNSPNNPEVTLLNKGVQRIDMSNNTLTLVDTLCPNTTNLLNDLGFNKTSWFSAGQNVNTTQGHFVGQFVFDQSANGTMIYQYYYSADLSDNLPDETSPYNIYFNISEGKLQFPEQWTDINQSLLAVQTTDETLHSKVPWARDSSGILANIYADIFKQEGLRWYYNNIANTQNVLYKEWSNFKINDLSCANDASGNWASFNLNTTETTAVDATLRTQIYQHAYNSVIGILRTSFPAFTQNFCIKTFDVGLRNIYSNDITADKDNIEYIWSLITVSHGAQGANYQLDLIYPNLKFITYKNISTPHMLIQPAVDFPHITRITYPSTYMNVYPYITLFNNMINLNTLIFMGNKPSYFDMFTFNNTNLKNIYYSEGTYGWTDTSLNHIGPDGVPGMDTTISPLPYNNNILYNNNNILLI